MRADRYTDQTLTPAFTTWWRTKHVCEQCFKKIAPTSGKLELEVKNWNSTTSPVTVHTVCFVSFALKPGRWTRIEKSLPTVQRP